MKKQLSATLSTGAAAVAAAGILSVDWWTADGGGGVSTGGPYAVRGTVAQVDAAEVMTGGNYSVTGGFWAAPQVVEVPGSPVLRLSAEPGGGWRLSWPAPSAGWQLQGSPDLRTWTALGPAVEDGGEWHHVSSGAAATLFFRLARP